MKPLVGKTNPADRPGPKRPAERVLFPSLRRRLGVGAVLIGLALAVGVGWYTWTRHSPPPVPPTLELTGIDTEAAGAIRAARAEVEQQPRSVAAWGGEGPAPGLLRLPPLPQRSRPGKEQGSDQRWAASRAQARFIHPHTAGPPTGCLRKHRKLGTEVEERESASVEEACELRNRWWEDGLERPAGTGRAVGYESRARAELVSNGDGSPRQQPNLFSEIAGNGASECAGAGPVQARSAEPVGVTRRTWPRPTATWASCWPRMAMTLRPSAIFSMPFDSPRPTRKRRKP